MSCVPSTVYFWLYSEDCDMWRKWSGFFPSLIYKRWDGCCNIYLSECGSSRSFSLSCRCAKEIICWDSAAAAAKEEEEIEPHSLNVIVMREIRQPKKNKKKQTYQTIKFYFIFFLFFLFSSNRDDKGPVLLHTGGCMWLDQSASLCKAKRFDCDWYLGVVTLFTCAHIHPLFELEEEGGYTAQHPIRASGDYIENQMKRMRTATTSNDSSRSI